MTDQNSNPYAAPQVNSSANPYRLPDLLTERTFAYSGAPFPGTFAADGTLQPDRFTSHISAGAQTLQNRLATYFKAHPQELPQRKIWSYAFTSLTAFCIIGMNNVAAPYLNLYIDAITPLHWQFVAHLIAFILRITVAIFLVYMCFKAWALWSKIRLRRATGKLKNWPMTGRIEPAGVHSFQIDAVPAEIAANAPVVIPELFFRWEDLDLVLPVPSSGPLEILPEDARQIVLLHCRLIVDPTTQVSYFHFVFLDADYYSDPAAWPAIVTFIRHAYRFQQKFSAGNTSVVS